MRGTLGCGAAQFRVNGIIPAYAGNTKLDSTSRKCGRDHPRVCGEHEAGLDITEMRAGSSPRMRGTLRARFAASIPRGIIPAYAGNTWAAASVPGLLWDHPRVCGEHEPRQLLGKRGEGSSPRMRGTPSVSLRYICESRIIPAYAGNTR